MTIIDKKKLNYILCSHCTGGSLSGVKDALRLGADVNAFEGWPLKEAAGGGYLDIVKFLVKNGADMTSEGGIYCGKNAPLFSARANRHPAVVEFLLKEQENDDA